MTLKEFIAHCDMQRETRMAAKKKLDTPLSGQSNEWEVADRDTLSMADILQHFIKQDERREERELKREEEREAREEKRRKEQQEADREWALKLEEREEQIKRADAEWRLAAGLKEREALAAQQQSLTEANAVMHVQQTQQQQYTALIARLPKFEGKEMPMAFVQALEKQLRDNRIPDDRWLQTLEACLQGKALQSYWTLVEEVDRRDYASAKDSVLRCLGPPVASRLDQVYNTRWVREESVAETWEESTQHVRSFCKDGDTAAEIRFK